MSKVFVAGATGVIGKPAVRALVEAGHDVTAVARSDERAALVASLGATPARVDLFDGDDVKGAVAGHDVVVNLATRIPPIPRAARPSAWAENDRIRREVSANLVDAALSSGASRCVQESITFTYPDRGDEWIDESVAIDPPPLAASVVAAEANARRFASADGGVGVVLRFAAFYAARSHHTELALRSGRRHIGAVAGRPDSYMSSIHADDAASAVVAALDVPSGTYNIGDDEPVRRREYAQALGAAIGVRPWLLLPGRLMKLAGRSAEVMTRSQRISNQAFRTASGWAPQYLSVREGFLEVAAHG
jgi:nucleoside-diphosphate-sugar epimerase